MGVNVGDASTEDEELETVSLSWWTMVSGVANGVRSGTSGVVGAPCGAF